MQFTEETNKRAVAIQNEFKEYHNGFPGLEFNQEVHDNFIIHKIAELELKIEALTPKPEGSVTLHDNVDYPMD